MPTAATKFLRAAHGASLASHIATAAAPHAAAMVPRSSCVAAVMAFRSSHDAKSLSDKDVESDEAVWALYERWCKAFNMEGDHAEMARQFKIFRYYAKYVHHFNTYLPPDPEEPAIYIQKRREAELLLRDMDFDECHLPIELGPFDDGGDPFIFEHCLLRLQEQEFKLFKYGDGNIWQLFEHYFVEH
uniref:Cathepsin propeptide inhibitor domain-containing protein n=1 Tax=Setaria italica TaxID=4555 RepID=K3YDG9_SETIT